MTFSKSILALTMAAAAWTCSPADARADYAFCSVASSSTRCDFQTYQQCTDTMSGVGGDCIANPAGPPAAAPTAPRTRKRKSGAR